MALLCLAGRRRAVFYVVYMDDNAEFYPSGDSRGQGCTLVWTTPVTICPGHKGGIVVGLCRRLETDGLNNTECYECQEGSGRGTVDTIFVFCIRWSAAAFEYRTGPINQIHTPRTHIQCNSASQIQLSRHSGTGPTPALLNSLRVLFFPAVAHLSVYDAIGRMTAVSMSVTGRCTDQAPDGRGNMLGLRPREFLARVHATSISGLVTLRVERATRAQSTGAADLRLRYRMSARSAEQNRNGTEQAPGISPPVPSFQARTDVPYRPPALVPMTIDRESLASRRAFGDNDRPVFCIQLQSICCEDIRDPHSAGEGAALAS
ncbi:hypothetical protein C8Q74DRAFT_1425350 [Fomes fomentarius]|nr:hypothetical protein C8Q74DRAFT_1425350 [Fomes fomentarius]